MGSPQTVVAERFLLRDRDGVVRAALGVNDQGEVALALFDGRGEARADIGVTQDGLPRVELFGSHGHTRALMNVDENDTPSLALYDRAKARIVATLVEDCPMIALCDRDSRRQITLAVQDGAAQQVFERGPQDPIVAVGIGADRSAGFSVYDGAHQPRVHLLLEDGGGTGLMVVTKDGRSFAIPPRPGQEGA